MKKLNLLIHVVSSVGWWGAVAAFLALAIAGVTGDAVTAATGLFITGWWVIVPLAVLATLTGFVQSLSGPWGLVRHWWVVFKIALTLPCTALLILHLQAVPYAAHEAATRQQMVIDAALALIVLMVPIGLSLYKPRGSTPWAKPAPGHRA